MVPPVPPLALIDVCPQKSPEPITETPKIGATIDLSPGGTYTNVLAPGETKKYFTEILLIPR